jgi:PKD repeat protein
MRHILLKIKTITGKPFLTLIFSVFLGFTNAQNSSELIFANQTIAERGEFYFVFDKPNPIIFNDLCENISIDNVKNNKVYAYANKNEFQYFCGFNIPFLPVDEYYNSSKLTAADMATSVAAMANWDKYPTFAVYCQMMQNFVTNYPTLCRLDTIGFSAVGHRPLLCLAISDNISQFEDEPEFFWSSTMHGDETTGIILTMRFADYLLSNYGTNTQVDKLINNAVIYICPMANPDGTFRLSYDGTSMANATRYNGNSKDLNRSFPLFPGTNFDPTAAPGPTENEVTAMLNYANFHNFVMSANIHGGTTVMNYPWDSFRTNQLAQPDKLWWEKVALIYANNAMANGPSGYFQDEEPNGITEGGDWYVITGSRQDYMNYYHHCREITIEVSANKALSSQYLNNYWNYNRQAMLDFTEQILYGFRGIITDDCSGEAIADVKVEIVGHDNYGTEVYSFAPLGNYFRPIYQGTYNVTFSKDGYTSKTLPVTVTNDNSITLNVSLSTDNQTIADFYVVNFSSCNPNIYFAVTFEISDTYHWDFGDGSFSSEPNPVHIYASSGDYTVVLTVTKCGQTMSSSQTIHLALQDPPAVTDAVSEIYGPDELTLTATGIGILHWYDAPNCQNLITTGNSYTNTFSETTTLYVQDVITTTQNYNVGPTGKINSSGTYTSSGNWGLYFDAEQEFVLNSVLVFADQEVTRTIQLKNNAGNVIYSKNITIPVSSTDGVRVYLDFDVPIGTNYQLILVTNAQSRLFRDGAVADYPYEIPGVVSITGNNAGSGTTNFYYYFYDWEITAKNTCKTALTPVTATINAINTVVTNFGNDDNVTTTIFPNPTDGKFSIISDHKIIKVEIYNHLGIRILQKKSNDKEIFLNLKLTDGSYYVKIYNNDNQIIMKKIIFSYR